jgi:hypothetical protein
MKQASNLNAAPCRKYDDQKTSKPSLFVLLNLQLSLLGAIRALLVARLALLRRRNLGIGARVLDDRHTVAVALDLLALVLLAAAAVIFALLEAVAAIVPVARLDGAAAVATLAGRAVAAVTASTASSTATASASSTTASASATATLTVAALVAVVVGLARVLKVGLDALLLALHDDVLLLAHDGDFVAVELGLGVERKELLLRVFRVELDKDAALPGAVILLAALAHHDGAVGAEELLERNLAGIVGVAEALGVGAGLELVGGSLLQAVEEVDCAGLLLLVAFLLGDHERLCALNGLVAGAGIVAVIHHDEILALAESADDCGVGAEAAHALEVRDVLDRDGQVLGAAELSEEVLVGDQVVGGKVELDLGAVSGRLCSWCHHASPGCGSRPGRPSRASCRILRCACLAS